MIDLYGMGSPNVMKIVLMLEELELPYRFHHVHVWKGEQYDKAFVALNPNSKVPVLVDSKGPGGQVCTIFESGAILIYLAEKHGQLLPENGTARYDVLQWLMVQLTGMGPMFGQHVHFSRFEPKVSDYARSRYTSESIRLVEVINQRLAAQAYLGGASYSIADVATYPWLSMLDFLGIPCAGYRNIVRWLSQLEARPAVQRLADKAHAIQKEGGASRAEATPDDFDRFFGRGRYCRRVNSENTSEQ